LDQHVGVTCLQQLAGLQPGGIRGRCQFRINGLSSTKDSKFEANGVNQLADCKWISIRVVTCMPFVPSVENTSRTAVDDLPLTFRSRNGAFGS
jgi:hypothetical protein